MGQRHVAWVVLLTSVVLSALIAFVLHGSARADMNAARPGAGASSHAPPIAPGAIAGDRGASAILLPPATIPIRFDHAQHHRAGATCGRCHPAATISRSAADRIGVAVSACDACHRSDHQDLNVVKAGPTPAGMCGACHKGYRPEDGNGVKRAIRPTPRLRFNHRAHAARNIACGQCHGALQRSSIATGAHQPRMRRCLTCHDAPAASRGDAPAGCPTCHLTNPGGELRTQFPEGALVPPRWLGASEHGPDFLHAHGASAANDSRFCARCHTEDTCVRCHDGRLRDRRVHPNDYLSMHGVAAKQSAQQCTSCHRTSSFCTTCHARAGVTRTGPPWARENQGRVHPPSDVFVTGPVSGRHHATEARRNLTACVGCHVERDCTVCHATRGGGGVGVDPHPAGFASRCGAALSRNARPCLVCHEPGDPLLSRCR